MRFMMLLPCPPEPLEKLTAAPNKEIVVAMRKYNDEMKKAGVLVLAEGLHATSKGFRLKVSGFWIIQVSSTEEALEWAKRCPLPENGLMEIRQIFEHADFPPELQKKTAPA